MDTLTPQTTIEPAVGLDAALLARIRQGDRDAFDGLVRRHRRVVYLTARRLLGSHEDADEAAQETFVRAWKSIERFRGEATVRTWLTRIGINVARSMLAARRPGTPLEEAAPPVDPGEGSAARVEREARAVRIRAAVGRLPPRQREVVLLKIFSEMTYREVAAVLGLSEGAVKAHLHQAVANLRRRMVAARDGGAT